LDTDLDSESDLEVDTRTRTRIGRDRAPSEGGEQRLTPGDRRTPDDRDGVGAEDGDAVDRFRRRVTDQSDEDGDAVDRFRRDVGRGEDESGDTVDRARRRAAEGLDEEGDTVDRARRRAAEGLDEEGDTVDRARRRAAEDAGLEDDDPSTTDDDFQDDFSDDEGRSDADRRTGDDEDMDLDDTTGADAEGDASEDFNGDGQIDRRDGLIGRFRADRARRAERTRALRSQLDEFGLTLPDDAQPGLAIDEVAADSLAATAGLEQGDRLMSIDGRPIDNLSDFSDWLENAEPGDSAVVELTRNGRRMRLHVHGLHDLGGDATFGDDRLFGGRRGAFLRQWMNESGFSLSSDGDLGLEIGRVARGGLAAEAGFEQGDRVLSINGQRVSDFNDVLAFAADADPNTPARFLVERDGERIEVDVAGLPELGRGRFAGSGDALAGTRLQRTRRFGVNFTGDGMEVGRLTADSLADLSGFQTGDVVVGIDGRRIESPSAFEVWLSTAEPGSTAVVEVIRNGRRVQLNLDLRSGFFEADER
jgi:S1-C subfamily serine protease